MRRATHSGPNGIVKCFNKGIIAAGVALRLDPQGVRQVFAKVKLFSPPSIRAMHLYTQQQQHHTSQHPRLPLQQMIMTKCIMHYMCVCVCGALSPVLAQREGTVSITPPKSAKGLTPACSDVTLICIQGGVAGRAPIYGCAMLFRKQVKPAGNRNQQPRALAQMIIIRPSPQRRAHPYVQRVAYPHHEMALARAPRIWNFRASLFIIILNAYYILDKEALEGWRRVRGWWVLVYNVDNERVECGCWHWTICFCACRFDLLSDLLRNNWTRRIKLHRQQQCMNIIPAAWNCISGCICYYPSGRGTLI